MATFHTTTTYDEDGIGPLVIRCVVSDTYEGLAETGTEVDVLNIRRTRRDLDIATGVYAEDEAEMTLYEWASSSAADVACMDFVKAAHDPDVDRFLAVFINPSDPPQVDEIDFRGRIRPDMSFTDVEWDGDEYVPPASIIREWEITAGSYDVTAILDQELWGDPEKGTTGLADALDPVALGVADTLGWFFSDGSDGHGHREARFCDIVDVQPILQALLDEAAPAGVTMTYEAAETAFECATTDMIPIVIGGTVTRYCYRFSPNPGSGAQGMKAPFEVPGTSGRFSLFTGNAPARTLAMDYKLLYGHTKEERALSWRRYKSLAELMYSLAATFDMFVEFEYVTPTDIRLRFKQRSDIIGNTVKLRDAIESSGDINPFTGTSGRKRFVGVSTPLVRDGAYPYYYDRQFHQPVETFRPQTDGDVLPLTISPSWCDYEDAAAPRPKDAGKEIQEHVNWCFLPHNAVFYDDPDTIKPEADPDVTFPPEAIYTTRAMHTGMYIRLPGTSVHGGHGIDGKEVVLPIRQFWAKGEGVELRSSETLSGYLNEMRGFDEGFFEKEVNQVVPGFNGFEYSGTRSWRHCALGAQHPYSGLTWTIAGVERDYEQLLTRIRSQESSRFTLSAPVINDDADGIDAEDVRKKGVQFVGRPAKGTVAAFEVVSMERVLDPGEPFQGYVQTSEANRSHRRRVLGINLFDAYEEFADICIVQLYGPCEGAASALPPDTPDGTSVFLRTGSPNLSIAPLTGANDTEDMYQEIGVKSGGNIIIDIKEPRVYQ